LIATVRARISVACRAGIQAQPGDADHAAPHTVAVDAAAAVEVGCAGGQGNSVGVDKPPAVDLDAGGVGDDHTGALAGDFDIPAQQAGVAGVHLIEDDTGGSVHPRVAADKAAELGLHGGAAIVQDDAVALDVELAVGIAGNPGGIRRLDVDERHAVGGGQHGGALVARGGGVSPDLRFGKRKKRDGGIGASGQRRSDHGRKHRMPGGTCLATRSLALRRRGFGHGHALAAFGVEDDAVQVFVHGKARQSGDKGGKGKGDWLKSSHSARNRPYSAASGRVRAS
jgi:hypothetical protein